jgi:endonuclease-8
MPEGPEIKRAADEVAEALVGTRAERVVFGLPRLKRHERRLAGRVVTAVEARGKAMLTRFEGGPIVYSHNQLYGVWRVCEPGRPPDWGRELRLAIHGERRWALLYSASEIEVLDAGALERHPFLARLGPDALDPGIHPDDIARRLSGPRFRRRRLDALLLDQGFVAGLGNYLRSEILYFARLHPAQTPESLGAVERRRLARLCLEVPRRSYSREGVTNSPTVVARLRRAGQPWRRYRFAAYGREGQPCHRCGERLRRLDSSGRGCFVCPSCQPAPDPVDRSKARRPARKA